MITLLLDRDPGLHTQSPALLRHHQAALVVVQSSRSIGFRRAAGLTRAASARFAGPWAGAARARRRARPRGRARAAGSDLLVDVGSGVRPGCAPRRYHDRRPRGDRGRRRTAARWPARCARARRAAGGRTRRSRRRRSGWSPASTVNVRVREARARELAQARPVASAPRERARALHPTPPLRARAESARRRARGKRARRRRSWSRGGGFSDPRR